jgi:CoA binding protein
VSDPLDAVFRPRAVAIVGASHDPTKRGYQAVLALQEAGFAGRILPVNPRGSELLGLPVGRSIAELDPAPDPATYDRPHVNESENENVNRRPSPALKLGRPQCQCDQFAQGTLTRQCGIAFPTCRPRDLCRPAEAR